MSHCTYLCGSDAYLSQDLLELARENMFFREPYKSNWRVLHIDGFEDYPRLPENRGKQIQFMLTSGVISGRPTDRCRRCGAEYMAHLKYSPSMAACSEFKA